MIKRVFIFVLCLMLFSVNVSAASPYASEGTVADVVFDCDKTDIAVGDLLVVDISFVNVSLENGYIACDLPLYYDKEMLDLNYQEVIAPDYWKGYEKLLFNPGTGHDYCWLRVIPEIPEGAGLSYDDVAIKEDKALTFRLVFVAKKVGETTLTIKNDEDNLIYMMIVGTDVKNYLPKGASLAVSVSASGDSSSAAESEPPVIDDSSAPVESEVPDESSIPTESEAPAESSIPAESDALVESSDESGETEVSEVSSEEGPAVEDSEANAEESGSVEDSDIHSEEVEESVASEDLSEEESNLAEGSAEGSQGDSSESKDDTEKKEEDSKLWLIVLIAAAVVAVAGICVAYFTVIKKNKKA